MARELLGPGEFLEVYVSTPLDVCEQRDPKGLYRKARSGLLKNFTGIDSAYEVPDNPEIVVDSSSLPAEILAERIVGQLLGDEGLHQVQDGSLWQEGL
jgi:bifunctional enzyme CysN/CysC